MKIITNEEFETFEMDKCIRLNKADQKKVGTNEYKGIAYFWNHEYRHYLRDTRFEKRREIHSALMGENLNVSDCSPRHLKIIKKYL